jgi:hypothetical protein
LLVENTRQGYFYGFAFFTADSGKGRRMKEELRSASRSFRSLQDGNETQSEMVSGNNLLAKLRCFGL